MERAAAASLDVLRQSYPQVRRIAIVCGGGNNGGDGYVLARLARAAALDVDVLAVVSPDRLQHDARRAFADWLASGGSVAAFAPACLAESELLVDALCGTGLASELRADALAAVAAMNAAQRPLLSLDVPSGLCSDTGRVLGAAVCADLTVSFVGLKKGLLLAAGPRHCGRLCFDALGIVAPARAEFAPLLERISAPAILAGLRPRARDAHKGSFGSVLIVGGGAGMPGAAALAARAALRVGAGRVRVACDPTSATAIVANTPEVMASGIERPGQLDDLLAQADTVLIGPGLGQSAWAQDCWQHSLAASAARRLPLVIDADGLNLLAADRSSTRPGNCILTPHPGEAARLVGLSSREVQDDRVGALGRLVERHGTVILKGACTLVGAPGHVPAVCTDGNPGMATAGMGDVLAGAVVGLWAQWRDAWLAATLAVAAHARAGDRAAQLGGPRGLLASDVLEGLRREINPA
jgi:NAD(P)H-hydrate epimerase